MHRLGGASLTAVIRWSYVSITILNARYMGDTERAVCEYQPSVAQRRGQQNVATMVASFVGSGVPWPSRAEISKLLQEADPYLGGAVGTKPLGIQAGVPPIAGDVDLAATLDKYYPELADQVRHPTAILLRPDRRSGQLPRPFALLHVPARSVWTVACKQGCSNVWEKHTYGSTGARCYGMGPSQWQRMP